MIGIYGKIGGDKGKLAVGSDVLAEEFPHGTALAVIANAAF